MGPNVPPQSGGPGEKIMTTYVLTPEKTRKSGYLPFKAIQEKNFADSLAHTKGRFTLIAEDHDALTRIFGSLHENFYKKQADFRKRISILLIADPPLPPQSLLEALFKEAIVIPHDAALSVEQISGIIKNKNAKDYVIGGQIDKMTHTVTLIRGDLSKLAIPFSTFRPSGVNEKPDFIKFSIEDSGQTIKFGEYEASVDAVLYEFDPLYRSKRKSELAKKDKSFGACLRRLRVLKGLKQSDFHDLDEREIGRIERGEVKPRQSTIEKLAEKLDVTPKEIESY